MATQDHVASIQGVGLRVTRLDASGNLLNGPGDVYNTTAFMRVSFTPEYEEGDEITEKSASGAVCVSFKSPDTLKRITMELAICDPDPELTNLVSGGLLLRKNLGTFATPNNKSIGWASPAIGDDPSGNGVAIETWSLAVAGGKKAGKLPYFQWIFPYAKLRQSGDRVIENGRLATTFEGFGLGNVEFGTGLDERWEFPVATASPYSYARTDWAPIGLTGFHTWHGVLTAAVTNKAISTGRATITTSTPHGFAVGETANVSAVGSPYDGPHNIISVPSATTFTFAVTGEADAASSAATGQASVGAGPRAVDELSDTGLNETYNVPGNVFYNGDKPTDVIVNSIDNPTV
jgi:hypothetical protein